MNYTRYILAIAMVGGALTLTACDDSREVKHEEKTKVRDDGTVEKRTETERHNSDGTVTKEEKKEVHR